MNYHISTGFSQELQLREIKILEEPISKRLQFANVPHCLSWNGIHMRTQEIQKELLIQFRIDLHF